MQGDTSIGKDRKSEPGRARLKLWHHMAPNPLSARLFFGALCTALWCMCFWDRVEIATNSVVYGLSGLQ
jgi:hypothetical protein